MNSTIQLEDWEIEIHRQGNALRAGCHKSEDCEDVWQTPLCGSAQRLWQELYWGFLYKRELLPSGHCTECSRFREEFMALAQPHESTETICVEKACMEQALTFIESMELRNYLREKMPECSNLFHSCAEIVAYAPAPVERKLPVLEELAPYTDAVPQKDFYSAGRWAQSCHAALAERYDIPNGTIFWLRDSREEREGYLFGSAFFTDFDAALRFLKKRAEEWPDLYGEPGISYTITKCVPDGSGRLDERCIWYMNGARELWYFDFYDKEDWQPLIDYNGDSLSLPVPFQPGDVIIADCLPYAAPRRVLVLDVGDNCDCCCLQVLFSCEKDILDIGAFKHNAFLSIPESSRVSGLYRAERWTGPLTDKTRPLTAEEEAFSLLSPLIHARPELGREIWDAVFTYKEQERKEGILWMYLEKIVEGKR